MYTSLIIPAFNEEKYLPQTLESVCKQEVIPSEIIICDNGSTDKTFEITDSYRKFLPIKIVKEPVRGITPAVEMAWRSARGKIILKTDADSILPSSWVKNTIRHFEKDPGLAACGGPIFASDGDIVDKFIIILTHTAGFYLLRALKGYPILLGGNFAIRRNVLQELGGYTGTGIKQDDQAICFKLHKSGYRFVRFWDTWNLSSVRRWHNSKIKYLTSPLSFFSRRFYEEKKT